MPLSNTNRLVEKYGQKLIDGSISEDELKELLERGQFPKSDGYVNPEAPVTDSNHSTLDALKDFTLTIAPQLSEDALHDITARLLEFAPDEGENTFLRNSTLEKCFFAYELAKFEANTHQHYTSNSRLKKIASQSENATEKYNKMLGMLIDFFKNPNERFTNTSASSDPTSHFGQNQTTFFETTPHQQDMNKLQNFILHYQGCVSIMPEAKIRAEKKYQIGDAVLNVMNQIEDRNVILNMLKSELTLHEMTANVFFSGQTKTHLTGSFFEYLEKESKRSSQKQHSLDPSSS